MKTRPLVAWFMDSPQSTLFHCPFSQTGIREAHGAHTLLVTLMLLGSQCLQASPPAVTPVASGDSFSLQWAPDSGVNYRVQTATNLSDPNGWVTEDVITSSSSLPVKWTAPELLSGSRFYRLALPEPEILDIEPSIVQAGIPVDLYIIGQGFGSNDTLRIGPLALTNRIVVSPTLMKVTFTPDVSGDYQFELVSAATGQTSRYSYQWTVVSQPAGSKMRLEPPSDPAATPNHTTYKQKIVENAVGEMRDYEKEPAHVEVPNFCPASGELQSHAIDLQIRGRGLDFVWARTYRSSTATGSSLGSGWDFSYNLYAQVSGTNILFHGGEGRDDLFHQQTNGEYIADGYFCVGSLSNNVFRITCPDGASWNFSPFDGTSTAGKIIQTRDRYGNAMEFSYDVNGRLSSIVDDLGRTNSIGYNSSGQLSSVTDFSGRTITYAYYPGGTPGGSPGDLQSITSPPITGTPSGNDFPAGKTTVFTYTTGNSDERLNHNLATVTDPSGQTWFQVFYRTNTDPAALDFDAVDYIQRGPYRIKLRRLPLVASPSNYYATTEAIINDGVGNVSECFYDAANRCVRRLEYTGRANPDQPTTDISNRPTGKLRQSDPDFYETLWSWDPDSLCTRVTLPDGEVTEFCYEKAFNQNASRSNHTRLNRLRVVHNFSCCDGADTDGDGVPDLTSRSWFFDYDPRFGWNGTDCRAIVRGWDPEKKESIAARGPRQTVSLDGTYSPRFGRKGWDGTVISRMFEDEPVDAARRKWDSDVLDFATKVVDPNRNVTTAAYDDAGDCILMHHQGRLLDASDSPVETFAYNAYGQLIGRTNAPDANGYRRVDVAQYYSSGPQAGYCATWTVDAQGPIVTLTSYEYDSHGNVTHCVDPRGNDCLWTYNAMDQCVRFESPTNVNARCVTDISYDANDNVLSTSIDLRDDTDTKRATKNRFRTYDALKRCLADVEQASASHYLTNGFSYDGDDNLVLVQTPEAVSGSDPTNVVAYSYDERNLLFQTVRSPLANACVTTCSYDRNGHTLIITATDALGNQDASARTSFAYDGFGRCVGVTDAMGNLRTKAFDADDNLVYERLDGETNDLPGSSLNQLLSECRYHYDSLNRCIHGDQGFFDVATRLALSDGASSTTWTFSPNGELTGVTDDNNHRTSYSYDTIGRLAVISDPKTNTVTYTYDAGGNPLTCVRTNISDLGGSPQVFWTACTYDPLNRCTTSADNVGNTNRYAYDSLDRCVRSIDPRGTLSGRTYDYAGRCVLAIADLDGDGILDLARDAGQSWTWNDNSMCVAITDANTNSTIYTYDSFDRCVQASNPDGTSQRLIWSPRSNLIGEQDANGTVCSNSFDALDRCVRRDITPAPGVAATTTFELFGYDGASRMTLASNDVSSLGFSYDSLGDCPQWQQNGLTVSCAFDGAGNCTSMVYPGGSTVQYSYDAVDQVSTINRISGGQNTQLASYSYDGAGQLARIFRANSMASRLFRNGMVSPPNAPGDYGWQQVSQINHGRQGVGSFIEQRLCAFDRNQNRTSRAQLTAFAQGQDTSTNTWGYDALNRLYVAINSKGSSVKRNSYDLDAKGNRVAVTNDSIVALYSRDATLPDPADFQMDQYTLTPFGSQQFDANGNLTARGTATGPVYFVYDCHNRLVEVDISGSTGTAAPVVSFAYDALGGRISKTSYPPAPSAPVTTECLIGGDMDRDGILERRQFGALLDSYVNKLDDGRLVARFNALNQATFYHCDDMGNVLALTDSKGSVVERYDYDDYGAPVFLTSDGVPTGASESAQGNPFLFRCLLWDGETGLYSTCVKLSKADAGRCASSYDPLSGRWVNSGGPNLPGTTTAISPAGSSFAGDNPWSIAIDEPGMHISSIAIDEPGVHFAGIAIKEQGVRRSSIAIDESGVRFAGIAIDEQGVHRCGIAIDEQGAHRGIAATSQEHKWFKTVLDGRAERKAMYNWIKASYDHKLMQTSSRKAMYDWIKASFDKRMVQVSNTKPMRDWIQASWDKRVERKSGSIVCLPDPDDEAMRYNFYECWPVRHKAPELDSFETTSARGHTKSGHVTLMK